MLLQAIPWVNREEKQNTFGYVELGMNEFKEIFPVYVNASISYRKS